MSPNRFQGETANSWWGRWGRRGELAFSKEKFTLDEIEFIQAATIKVLVAASKGQLDLNRLARQELAERGLDQNGIWVGFELARRLDQFETSSD